MKRLLAPAVIGLFALTSQALSGPEGSWPDASRGLGVPETDWILVVPAERDENGDLAIFDRKSEWVKGWTVPKATPAGKRTVTLMGDAEDKRILEGWQVDGMDTESLGIMIEKYKAPAIAVAVKDVYGETAVAAWVPGAEASWNYSGATRDDVLASLDALMSGPDFGELKPVYVSGQRSTAGGTEFRLDLPSYDDIAALEQGGTVFVKSRDSTGIPQIVVSVAPGWTLEEALREAGYFTTN